MGWYEGSEDNYWKHY